MGACVTKSNDTRIHKEVRQYQKNKEHSNNLLIRHRTTSYLELLRDDFKLNEAARKYTSSDLVPGYFDEVTLDESVVSCVSIHDSIEICNLKSFRGFIKDGVDVETKDCDGCTPLHVLTKTDVTDTYRIILIIGNNSDRWYMTNKALPLRTIHMIKMLMIRKLIQKGADIESRDGIYRTPLHHAISRHDLRIVRYLIKHGADVNAKYTKSIRSKKNRTPLHHAVKIGNLGIFKELVWAGADLDARDGEGRTAMEIGALSHDYSTYENFVRRHLAVLKIQGLLKIIWSKRVARNLRMSPENLFDPTYSWKREIILGIDSSRFGGS